MSDRKRFGILDQFAPAPFRFPPIACGDYTLALPFGAVLKYFVRRMPRRAKYTGRYGLFYYDPDAHEQLVGVLKDSGWECVQPGIYQKEYDAFWKPPAEPRVLVKRRCAWCGRELHTPNTTVHMTATCNRTEANAGTADPEEGVF